MNLEDLNKLDEKAIQQFFSLKRNIVKERNDDITNAKADEAFDYIASQLRSNEPDEFEVMEKLNFLSTIGGIQAYMKDYKPIIARHLALFED